jgi:flagellar capping protein FliD
MDISSITQLSSSVAATGSTQAGGIASRQVAPQTAIAPEAAPKRGTVKAEEQLASTKVELSAQGQVKAAFAELQTAARAVTEPQRTATAEDTKQAVENFVSAFNKANAAVNNATKTNAKEADASAGELRRAASEANGSAELKKAGIAQNRDGSLSVDSRALETSLRERPAQTVAAVAETGRKVERTATRELAAGGNADSAAALDNRNRRLEAEQSAQQAVVVASQTTIEQQSANVTKLASSVAAYQRNFLG